MLVSVGTSYKKWMLVSIGGCYLGGCWWWVLDVDGAGGY